MVFKSLEAKKKTKSAFDFRIEKEKSKIQNQLTAALQT